MASGLPIAASLRPTRRELLQGAAGTAGALVLGTFVVFPRKAFAQAAKPINHDPNVFLRIGADDSVTVLSKHLEMGQGVSTGLATLVAEELNASWASIRVEHALNNPAKYLNLAFGMQGTGGSTSMANSWEQMRMVGAAARTMLIQAGALQWGVSPAEVVVEDGVVHHRASGRRSGFGALAAAAMALPVPTDVVLKEAKAWKYIGKRVPRVDSVSKTTGKAVYAMDFRRPGMLTAVVRRPELFGATLLHVDTSAAMQVPGVVEVVRIPSGVAVLAKDTWSAIRGRDALKVTWDAKHAETRSTPEMLSDYRQSLTSPGNLALARGDAEKGLLSATKTVEGEFTFPFLAHAPMEPMNAVMERTPDGVEMWAGSQIQTIDTAVAAHVLGLKPEQVKINTLFSGGSFGRRANTAADWTAELANILKAMKAHAPVHLVWTREDDIRGGFYRPMALHHVRAGVDATGRVVGWHHQIACQSIFIGTPMEAFAVKNGVDNASVEGIVDTDYALSDLRVESTNQKSAIPVLWWRSVGNNHTAFVMEVMMDDLARAAGKDAVQFRVELLAKDARAVAVCKLAAERAGWGSPVPAGMGRGFAYHHSFGTRVAMVADVSFDGKDIRIERIVTAVDCGVAINPDQVLSQVEGAVGFGVSMVLRNRITLDKGRVVQGNFNDFEPTRIFEMPRVELHIVPSLEPPSGIGEPPVPPLAPAIANAFRALTGQRLRSLPLAPAPGSV
jgi:isoquinoline 1-oxidoreductase beta subunit